MSQKSQENWISPDRKLAPEETVFKINPTSLGRVFFYAVLLSLPLILLTFGLYLVVMPILALFSAVIWVKYGQPIAYKIIINSVKKELAHEKLSFFSKLIGIEFDPDMVYFLEAEQTTLDLTKTKQIVKEKVTEVLFTSLGFAMLIFQIYYNTIGDITTADEIDILVISMFALSIIPAFLFFVIPTIWTIDDLQIRGVDDRNRIDEIEQKVREGIFSKIFGTAGLLLGYDFILGIVEQNLEGSILEGDLLTSIPMTLAILGGIFLFNLGLPVFLTTLYLQKYHEPFVNSMRKELRKHLAYGLTSVRKLGAEEIPNESIEPTQT